MMAPFSGLPATTRRFVTTHPDLSAVGAITSRETAGALEAGSGA